MLSTFDVTNTKVIRAVLLKNVGEGPPIEKKSGVGIKYMYALQIWGVGRPKSNSI